MNILGLISQLIGIKTLRLTKSIFELWEGCQKSPIKGISELWDDWRGQAFLNCVMIGHSKTTIMSCFAVCVFIF